MGITQEGLPSVFIASPHQLLSEGLGRVLGDHGIKYLGQATNPQAALDQLRAVRANVFLCDTQLEGLNLPALLPPLEGSQTKTVLLGPKFHPAELLLYGRLGIFNVVLLTDTSDALVKTILASKEDCIYHSPAVTKIYDSISKPNHIIESLTVREAEVLSSWVIGVSGRKINGQLGIRAKTLEAHLRSIFLKSGTRSRDEIRQFSTGLIITAQSTPGKKRY